MAGKKSVIGKVISEIEVIELFRKYEMKKQEKQMKIQNYSKYKYLISLLFLIGGFVVLNHCGKEQPKSKVYRVGILCGLDYLNNIFEGFRNQMEKLGYIEGRNIIYELHKTNFEPEKEKQIVESFINQKVDVILTFPTEVSIIAKTVTEGTDVPVVFSFANIEGTNLVESISSPGGNITGVRYPGPDIANERLEVLLELVPMAKRIWIPYQRGYPIVDIQLEALQKRAPALGIKIEEFPADDAAELETHLNQRRKLKDIGIDAILFIAEPLGVNPGAFAVISKFASEYKIPCGGVIMTNGEYSSLYGVNMDIIKAGEQAALLVEKILNGIPASSIPVISAESYFEVNYAFAKKIGVTIDEGMLSRADKIIR